jgi:hypothetical protein
MAVSHHRMNAMDDARNADAKRCVAELAARLVDRVPDAVSLIEASVREEIPEMIPETRDEAQIALLDDAVQGNVETILYALRHNISAEDVQAPTATIEHTRRLAQQGVPLTVLIRGYRMGQRRLTHLVFGELHSIDIAPESRIGVVEAVSEMLFAYVDWMSQQIIAIYQEERERWLESNNSLRALRVREVLAGGKHVDADTSRGAAPVGAGGFAGQGPRAGHQHADEPDCRGSAARASGRHPGPNIAREVAEGYAAAAVLAMPDQHLAANLAELFRTKRFRTYTTDDVVGVEMAGALKKSTRLPSAWATQSVSGKTPAMVMTRAVREMSKLGEAAGGHRDTFAGLAGMGDLIVTCTSQRSRNRHVGEQLGAGKQIDEIIASMNQVAEGVKAVSVVMEFAKSYGLSMPIAREVDGVINHGATPEEAYRGLGAEKPGHEVHGAGF